MAPRKKVKDGALEILAVQKLLPNNTAWKEADPSHLAAYKALVKDEEVTSYRDQKRTFLLGKYKGADAIKTRLRSVAKNYTDAIDADGLPPFAEFERQAANSTRRSSLPAGVSAANADFTASPRNPKDRKGKGKGKEPAHQQKTPPPTHPASPESPSRGGTSRGTPSRQAGRPSSTASIRSTLPEAVEPQPTPARQGGGFFSLFGLGSSRNTPSRGGIEEVDGAEGQGANDDEGHEDDVDHHVRDAGFLDNVHADDASHTDEEDHIDDADHVNDEAHLDEAHLDEVHVDKGHARVRKSMLTKTSELVETMPKSVRRFEPYTYFETLDRISKKQKKIERPEFFNGKGTIHSPNPDKGYYFKIESPDWKGVQVWACPRFKTPQGPIALEMQGPGNLARTVIYSNQTAKEIYERMVENGQEMYSGPQYIGKLQDLDHCDLLTEEHVLNIAYGKGTKNSKGITKVTLQCGWIDRNEKSIPKIFNRSMLIQRYGWDVDKLLEDMSPRPAVSYPRGKAPRKLLKTTTRIVRTVLAAELQAIREEREKIASEEPEDGHSGDEEEGEEGSEREDGEEIEENDPEAVGGNG